MSYDQWTEKETAKIVFRPSYENIIAPTRSNSQTVLVPGDSWTNVKMLKIHLRPEPKETITQLFDLDFIV